MVEDYRTSAHNKPKSCVADFFTTKALLGSAAFKIVVRLMHRKIDDSTAHDISLLFTPSCNLQLNRLTLTVEHVVQCTHSYTYLCTMVECIMVNGDAEHEYIY